MIQSIIKDFKKVNIVHSLPILLLFYDNFNFLFPINIIPIQSLPLSSVYSVFYIILNFRSLKICSTSKKILNIYLIILIYMSLITLLNLIFTSNFSPIIENFSLRLISTIRQFLSLSLGISCFLMFQDIFLKIEIKYVFKLILFSFSLVLIICLIQFFYGKPRIMGFSSEPGLFADMLVFYLLPAIIFAIKNRFLKFISGSVFIFLLSLTSSFVGILKFTSVLIINSLSKRNNLILLIITPLILFLIFLQYVPKYLLTNIELLKIILDSNFEMLYLSASFTDKLFSFIGPITNLNSFNSIIGYGFGSDASHFYTIFPQDIALVISDTRGILGISSVHGKIILYGGLLSYSLFITSFIIVLKRPKLPILFKSIIFTILATSTISLTPFMLTYIWFWLALGSTYNEYENSQILE